jgi:hypothetical protein
MKKIIFTCYLLTIFFLSTQNLLAQSNCSLRICTDSSAHCFNYSWPGGIKNIFDTAISQPDTINLVVNIYHDLATGGCADCQFGTITWYGGVVMDNGLFFLGHSYLIKDTGSYMVIANAIGNGCYSSFNDTLIINVGYYPTSVSEINNQNIFKLYPSISSGLFQIKTKEQLKKIVVTDGVGRIVYSSATPVSEINLSGVSDGIYFYAIEDEKERVFRGKIVKE